MTSRCLRGVRAARALVRVELRQWGRHRWRSFLLLMLVAVPVAAMVGGTILVRAIEPTPDQRAARAMGRADLRVDGISDWQSLQEVRQRLPEGHPITRGFEGIEQVGVAGRRVRARLVALAPGDLAPEDLTTDETRQLGLAYGMVHLLSGRPPANAGEVALSPSLLEGLDRSVGDTVTLAYGGSRVITASVVDPEDLDLPLVLRTPAVMEYPGRHFLLADLPPGTTEVIADDLRTLEVTVRSRRQAAVRDEALTALVFALGTLGLFEAALIISAAFAISLRRRQVEIGLLASTGATRTGITSSLLVSAAVLALVGGVLGSLLGIGAAALVHPWLGHWTRRLTGSFEVIPSHVVGAIVLGVLAAVLAAWLPARSSVRLSVRDALAGRRPTARRSRRWLLVGLLLVVSGLLLLTLAPQGSNVLKGLAVVGGPILGILGFGACSPWFLEWLASRAASLPLAWRLALRDAGRFRERNGAVVTAVLAGMAMSVTMAALVASLELAIDAFPAPYRDDHLLVEGPDAEATARSIASRLPTLAAAPLRAAYSHGEPVRGRFRDATSERRQEWIAVGSEDLLTVLGAEAGRSHLDAGQLLVLDNDPSDSLDDLELTAWVDGRTIEGPKAFTVATGQTSREPRFLLSAGALPDLGLETGPPPRKTLVPWLLRLDGPVTREQLEEAQRLAASALGTSVDAALLHQSPFRPFYYLVLFFCAVTGLLVVIIATALSAAESAADERILHTVGAAPRLLRSHLASRAGYLAWLGCLLAIPAGLIAAFALFDSSNFPLEFVVPWRDLAVLVVGFPAIVYLGTWWFGRPASATPISQ